MADSRLDSLLPFLDSKDLRNGIHVTVSYKDLTGDSYQSQWRLNPFLYKDTRLCSQVQNSLPVPH